jgi:tRNA (cytidine56-2'-O)-methyltransferase
MRIEVLRIGQRLVRDDRVTTHVALVSRAFGASKILMQEVNPEIKKTISDINRTWGSTFEVEIIDNWKKVLKSKKNSFKIVHLTMYGESIDSMIDKLRQEEQILIVVGAEKVPREAYDLADYSVAVGNQPHSEISALAVLLDRVLQGRQFLKKHENARRRLFLLNTEKK